MPSESFSVATSVAINADAIAGSRYSRKPFSRRLVGVGMAGSTAPGDWQLRVEVEGGEMSNFKNSRGGANTFPNNDDMQACNIPIPANFLLEMRVIIATTTNPGQVLLVFI